MHRSYTMSLLRTRSIGRRSPSNGSQMQSNPRAKTTLCTGCSWGLIRLELNKTTFRLRLSRFRIRFRMKTSWTRTMIPALVERHMTTNAEASRFIRRLNPFLRFWFSELGGYGRNPNPSRIQVTQRIPHKNEINRARYMPQNPDLIATKTTSGSIYVFDRTKHPSEPPAGKEIVCKPDIELVGQLKEGHERVQRPASRLTQPLQVWYGLEPYKSRSYIGSL